MSPQPGLSFSVAFGTTSRFRLRAPSARRRTRGSHTARRSSMDSALGIVMTARMLLVRLDWFEAQHAHVRELFVRRLHDLEELEAFLRCLFRRCDAIRRVLAHEEDDVGVAWGAGRREPRGSTLSSP